MHPSVLDALVPRLDAIGAARLACADTSCHAACTRRLDELLPKILRIREVCTELDGVESCFGGFAADLRYPDGDAQTAFVAVDVCSHYCCESPDFDCSVPTARGDIVDGRPETFPYVVGARVVKDPRFGVTWEWTGRLSYSGDGEAILIETDRGRVTLRAWNDHNGYYAHDAVAKLPGKPLQEFSL